MRLVERHERLDVNVGEPVAIGDHEEVVLDVSPDPLDPPAGHRVLPGIGQGDGEVLLAVAVEVVDLGLPAELDHEVVVQGLVVQEVFLDHPAPIAQAEDEVLEPVVGEELHDVPEDGPLADQDQRLRPILRLFPEAGALATAEDHDFHEMPLVMAGGLGPGGRQELSITVGGLATWGRGFPTHRGIGPPRRASMEGLLSRG